MKPPERPERPWRQIWNLYKQGGLPSALNSVVNMQNAQQMAYVRSLLRQQRAERLEQLRLDALETVVFDLETTGFSPYQGDEILSVGAVRMTGTSPDHAEYYSLVNPGRTIPRHIEELTGILSVDARKAPELMGVLHDFFRFSGSRVLIAHATGHDKTFLKAALWRTSRTHFNHRILDTMMIAEWLHPEYKAYDLDSLLPRYQIRPELRHHALHDARATAELWGMLLREILEGERAATLAELYAGLSGMSK